MARNLIETVMGAVVLIVAIFFVVFAYESSDLQSVDGGYAIEARFDSVSGLGLGADVRIGGIKVGVVSDLLLDNNTYQALVQMEIDENTKLPKDSSAAVVSDGLLGSKYLDIVPGADDAMLRSGDAITYTQSSVNLESLIGKMVFSGGGVDDGAEPSSDELPSSFQ